MKIIFPFYSPNDSGTPLLYSKMLNYLFLNYEVEIIPIVFGKTAKEYLLKNCPNVKFQMIYDINDYMMMELKNFTVNDNEMRIYEEKYGIPNLQIFYQSNFTVAGGLNVHNLTQNDFKRLLALHFKFWEKVFNEQKPDIFFGGALGGSPFIAIRVAERHGIIPVDMITSRFLARTAVMRNPYDRWENMNEMFNMLKKRPLSAQERLKATSFINKFKELKSKPTYVNYSDLPYNRGLKAPTKFLKFIYNYYNEKSRGLLINRSPYSLFKDHLARVYRYFIGMKNLWDIPIEGEKFILYPIQYDQEASLIIWAPYYINQLSLIENISKSLPINHMLYVKEHRANIGLRPMPFYNHIKRLPNVRLVSPFLDSHDLIKKADCITTISGTIGWESILYQKPVIIFGTAFYDAFDLIYKVDDIRELPNLLNKAVYDYKPDEELLLKFVLACLESTYDGDIAWDAPGTNCDDNAQKLCHALASELNMIMKQK